MRVKDINNLPDHIQAQIKDDISPSEIARQQTIFVRELPPGLNGDDGLMRMHWTKYRVLRDKWIRLIDRQKPKKHIGRVAIAYTRKSVQMMDYDNLSASFKPVGDALEHLGVIEDDSPKTMDEFIVRWEKADKLRTQGVRIEITNV